MVKRPLMAPDIALKSSALAYIKDPKQLRTGLSKSSAVLIRAFDVDSTEALLIYYPVEDFFCLAFRGTEADYKDIITDITAWPAEVGGGRIHSGFYRAMMRVLPDIKKVIKDHKISPSKLIFTGHSLGGAIATLLSYYLECSYLITFGCPRAADASFLGKLKAHNRFRYVNKCDIVPQLPRPWMFGYRHPSYPWYINRRGDILLNPGAAYMVWDRLRSVLFVPSILARRKFIDHRISEYAKSLDIEIHDEF